MFDVDISMTLSNGHREKFSLESHFSVQGRRLVLFGPSGSGKTMTLRALAGLSKPDKGHIRINGATLFDAASNTNLPPRRRKIGFIFQDYALFPHMTVRQNIRFGARRMWRRLNREQSVRIEELIALFGLEAVADSLPNRISGGQKQRVAMARGLASEPDMLLLDEPFSALDVPLRKRMYAELAKTLEAFRLPMVLVTHNIEEMVHFADTVVVMDHGRVTAVEGEPGKPVDAELVRGLGEQAYAKTIKGGPCEAASPRPS